MTRATPRAQRDEGLHTQFACALHAELQERCDAETIRSIVLSAVEVEKQFVEEALKVALIGMNAKDMGQYVEFVADYLLVMLGCDKAFNTANPFDFMTLISLQGKTNFFEKRVGEYAKAGVMASLTTAGSNHNFSVDDDF